MNSSSSGRKDSNGPLRSLASHWPEYLMEAWGLGMFMISACVFASLVEYPGSPLRQVLPDAALRRALMGLAMGLTAIAIIYSPWGRQSGAHINPAITLAFLRLGKVEPWDGFYYVLSQFVGGLAGVWLSVLALGVWVSDPAVNYVVTVPGEFGVTTAFGAELLMSLGLVLAVLVSANEPKWAGFTGVFAGGLVATYIMLEAPISGMSINPARSFGSAVPARLWTAFWVYLLAPPLGMLIGAELYLRWRGAARVSCAKLNHHTNRRCIFRCGYQMSREGSPP